MPVDPEIIVDPIDNRLLKHVQTVDGPADGDSLTPRQWDCLKRFIGHNNLSKAAVEAGFSENWAKQNSYAWIKRPEVAACIKQLRADRDARNRVDADWIMKRAKYVYKTAMSRPLRVDDEGNAVYAKPDLSNALKALELIAKLTGNYHANIDVTSKGEKIAVTTEVKQVFVFGDQKLEF